MSNKFFDTSNLRGDIYGGLTAGVVALPLALAFGEASGESVNGKALLADKRPPDDDTFTLGGLPNPVGIRLPLQERN